MHSSLTGRARRQRRASGPRRRARVRHQQPQGGAHHPQVRWGIADLAHPDWGDGEGKLVISTREGAYKTRNLRRDPRTVLCVFSDGFFDRWMQIEGTAQIVSLPEALDGLVDYYRRISGEHHDWDDYRRAMEHQQRVLVRVSVDTVGPTRAG